FDKIIEKWSLEKIKTVGDAYMCAGGIPIRDKMNPVNTVLAGLEIRDFILDQKEILKEDQEGWNLRIGIHTGELTAGVIG
ncbi:MAG: adenylate/guanylate cyclase domain-containing protein, partial [Flavobacteriales bacterium]